MFEVSQNREEDHFDYTTTLKRKPSPMFACTPDFLSLLEGLPFVVVKKKRPRLSESGASDHDDDQLVIGCSHLLTLSSFETTSSTITYTDDEFTGGLDDFEDDDDTFVIKETSIIDHHLDRYLFSIEEQQHYQDGNDDDDLHQNESTSLATGPLPELLTASSLGASSNSSNVGALRDEQHMTSDANHGSPNNKADEKESDEQRDSLNTTRQEEEETANDTESDDMSVVPLASPSQHALLQPELLHHMVKLANVGGGQMLGSARFTFDNDDDYESASSFDDTNKQGDTKPLLFIVSTAEQALPDDETTLTDVSYSASG